MNDKSRATNIGHIVFYHYAEKKASVVGVVGGYDSVTAVSSLINYPGKIAANGGDRWGARLERKSCGVDKHNIIAEFQDRQAGQIDARQIKGYSYSRMFRIIMRTTPIH